VPLAITHPAEGDHRIPPPGERSPHSDRGNRCNEQIRISPVRLIGAEGEQFGVVPTSLAMEKAREAGLDLVEVAPLERPPVCKIMDYGKFRYEQGRKQAKAKGHQQKRKEIRLRPKTGVHDIETKLGQARKFLEHHDKVVLRVKYSGREMQHQEEGRKILTMMVEKLADVSKVEQMPRMEGKQLIALLAPKT
jgi:translation initiation factor IF-3